MDTWQGKKQRNQDGGKIYEYEQKHNRNKYYLQTESEIINHNQYYLQIGI